MPAVGYLDVLCGRVDVTETLLDGGADPAIPDGLYHSTPAGWAERFGRYAARDALRRRIQGGLS